MTRYSSVIITPWQRLDICFIVHHLPIVITSVPVFDSSRLSTKRTRVPWIPFPRYCQTGTLHDALPRRHSHLRTTVRVDHGFVAQHSAPRVRGGTALYISTQISGARERTASTPVSYAFVEAAPTFGKRYSGTETGFSIPAATSAMSAAPTPEPSLAIPMRMRLAPSSPIPWMTRSAS